MKKSIMLMLVLGACLAGAVDWRLVADEPPQRAAKDADAAAGGFAAPAKGDTAPATADRFDAAPPAAHDESTADAIAPSANGKKRASSADTAPPSAFPIEEEAEEDASAAPADQRPAAAAPRYPGREAVVDVQYLFQHLGEFQRERERLKRAIEQSDREMQTRRKELQALQDRLKHLAGEDRQVLEPVLQQEIDRRSAELTQRHSVMKRNFLREEARIYQQVYDKITAEVARYAQQHGIRIVRRANLAAHRRRPPETSDPQAVIQRIQQEVIYIQRDELDITEEILQRLEAKDKGAQEE